MAKQLAVLISWASSSSAWWPYSQSDQDDILASLLAKDGIIGATNHFAVEFGYADGTPGSNTGKLVKNVPASAAPAPPGEKPKPIWEYRGQGPYAKAFNALLLDNKRISKPSPPYAIGKPGVVRGRANITSANIVTLFKTYQVPVDADYVSIDLDTADVWVLQALLEANYRPRVVSIEYNSNFPEGAPPLAYPDPTVHTILHDKFAFGWRFSCYMGSTAEAIRLVAKKFGCACEAGPHH